MTEDRGSGDSGQSEFVSLDGVLRIDGVTAGLVTEDIASEEPLEIRLAGLSVAVTMRTPGHDFDLVRGFVVTEGILVSVEDIESMSYCPDEGAEGLENIVNVSVRDPKLVDPSRWQRNFYASSSCGICGKASIDAVRLDAPDIVSDIAVTSRVLATLPASLLEGQATFRRTGGLHAAGIFDVNGKALSVREDVGRHNAVDKVLGDVLRTAPEALPSAILQVSGRASFEIVQKALMTRVPIISAVSAPSSLAVQLARASGMTLVGFVRGQSCNVYAGHDRVIQS